MSERVEIQVGTADRDGKRAVFAMLGGRAHPGKFDPMSEYHRRKFRENVVEKFQLGDDAHEAIEESIIAATAAADEQPFRGVPNVVCMADVPALKTEWHWEGHIPIGGLTIIDGEAGLSKSTLTVDLGARATRGDAPPPLSAPDGTFARCNVLYLSPEDDPSRTLRPRLDAAGADLKRVFLLQSLDYCDGAEGREIKLPLDVEVIRQTVQEKKIRLVFIDPLTAHVGDLINTNSDSSVRSALMPLNRMAQAERVAVILVRHLSKAQGRSAMNSGLGSVGIMATCRAGFLVAREEPGSHRIIMACSKMNLARKPKSLAYTVVDHAGTSRIEWEGAVDVSADDLVSNSTGGKSSGPKLELAQDIIRDLLATGPRGSNEVMGACTAAGVGERTYHAARKSLGVVSERTGFGGDGQWLLTLPNTANGYHGEF